MVTIDYAMLAGIALAGLAAMNGTAADVLKRAARAVFRKINERWDLK